MKSSNPWVAIDHLLGEEEGRFVRLGHFAYEGGDHGDTWLALDLLFARPRRAQAAAARLAAALAVHRAALVCGPLVGGALLGQLIAAELDAGFVYGEPRPADRGEVAYIIPPESRRRLAGRTVIVVDDVINAGSATRACIREIEAAGGRVVAAGSLIIRDATALRELLGLPATVRSARPASRWAADRRSATITRAFARVRCRTNPQALRTQFRTKL